MEPTKTPEQSFMEAAQTGAIKVLNHFKTEEGQVFVYRKEYPEGHVFITGDRFNFSKDIELIYSDHAESLKAVNIDNPSLVVNLTNEEWKKAWNIIQEDSSTK